MINNSINNANIIQREIKTSRESISPISAKIKGGRCVNCGCIGFKRVQIHGQNNGVYLCDSCYNGNIDNYHTSQRNGYTSADGLRVTKDNISIGQEMEVIGFSPIVLAHFSKLGYHFEKDCTVTMEGISPIFTSMSGLSKILGLMEYYQNNPNIKFDVLDSRCGLHTNYGYNNRPVSANIKNNCTALFQPIADYIANLSPDKQREIFGRAVNDSCYVDRHIESYNHYSMFNFQHSNTIEFRLMKFRTAESTAKAVKIIRSIMEICFKNDGIISNEKITQKMLEKLDKEVRHF